MRDEATPHQSLVSPTILVVDDEPAFTDTLSDILGAKGYVSLAAGTGREGEQIAADSQPDLALVDLKLPDITGVELLGRLRECSPETEVIILTGHASLDTALRAISLGAFAYIEKPYDVDRLFVLIEQALARRRTKGLQSGASELTRMIDSLALPAFAFDTASGRVAAFNDAFGRFLDLHDAVSPGPAIADLLPGDGVAARHLTELQRQGHARTELRLAQPHGEPRWCELETSLIGSRPGFALGLLRDVTERREVETDLRQTRQYNEAILNTLAAGVAIIDSRFSIQRVNPEFARFYRLTPEQLVGRKCHDVIHGFQTPCQLHGEVCPIVNCLALGTTTRVQHRHLNAEGQARFQECTMTPLRDESGTVVSFIAMYTDFTDIKLAQEESEAKSRELESLNDELTAQGDRLAAQAVELERANAELVRLAAAKDDFVSTVSHELRTPLTAISEGISLVADGSLGPANELQAKFLALAHKNCARLTELINDILDLSKIEAGRMDARPARIDIAQLCSELRDTFAFEAQEKQLACEAAGVERPLFVFADERMVRRILTNLLSNAVKFTDHGRIRLSIESKSDHAVVCVADTGIGIPATQHARMFERFHQVHQKDRGRPAGTGLGLALTRQMVEMNSGRIWFESQEGVGSRFYFTLPLDNDVARVASIFSHRQSLLAARRPRGALLVAVGNAGELRSRFGEAGLAQVREELGSLLTNGHAAIVGQQSLPDRPETLLLLDGSEAELEAQLRAIRERLADATFMVDGKTARVRLTVGACRLNGPVDAREFLNALRKEAACVN